MTFLDWHLTKWFPVVFCIYQVMMWSLAESTVNKPKIILYWNTFYNQTDMTFGFGQQPFLKSGCEISNCIATDDRNLFNQSDGVIIHAGDCTEHDLPTHRFPHQRFIFLNHQPFIPGGRSPLACFSRPHFYNWTMSHRRDSDVHLGLPYGTVRRRKNVINRVPYKPKCRQLFNRSKLLITWFDSRCSTQSQREIYVEKLAELVPVDIYGKCGSLKCLPENDPRCQLRVLIDEYKFYLAAEEFLCPDYVTENFYRALMNDIVPVVYGGADYTQYAPPNSYVNVADFETPKELAEYLLLLDKNDALYSKYFEWKRDYEVIPQTADGWCDLCKKLNDPSQEKKSY